MTEPFFAPEVIEQALRDFGIYSRGEEGDNAVVSDAQFIVDALHAAGFRIVRTASSSVTE